MLLTPTLSVMNSLLERIEILERENIETTNVLYEIITRIELLENDRVLQLDKFREGNDNVCK
jgi:hypothetical protein